MAQFEKHFTVSEANALLPELRVLLGEIQEVSSRIAVDWEKAIPVIRAAPTNGGGKEAGDYLASLGRINTGLRRLAGMGIQLKDLERGLVDFPAWRGDEEVLLCWHLGEDEVRYWHDLESGFAGRQELE